MMKVDFAIITMRDDETDAVLDRFNTEPQDGPSERIYGICHTQTITGKKCTVAVARCIDQGNDTSQQIAHDVISDFDPQLLLVVGIAGGIPHPEFTLGDVILSSSIRNFNLRARKPGGVEEYDIKGEAHQIIKNAIAGLSFYKNRHSSWNNPSSITLPRPYLDPQQITLLGTDTGWREKVKSSLLFHFGNPQNSDRLPLFKPGTIASSNELMQDPVILIPWLKSARTILAVEMESAGVLQAANKIQHQYPVMAIRGISDIVGLKREDHWTTYSCHTAAAFAHAFVTSGIITPREDVSSGSTSVVSTAPSVSKTSPEQMQLASDGEQTDEGKGLRVFISYAQSDEKLKKQLETHLTMLQREGMINPWNTRKISAGDEWMREIDQHIDSAQIILLLVSPTFLASNYSYENEVKRAMERHDLGEACVIPIILRAVDWHKAPFGKLLALPRNGIPVKSWNDADSAWYEVVTEIRQVCEQMQKKMK